MFMTGHRRAVWKDIVFLLSVEEKQPCQTKSYSYHLVRGKVFTVEDQAYENQQDRNCRVGQKRGCADVPAGAVHFDESKLNAENTNAKQNACPVQRFNIEHQPLVLNGKQIKSNTGGSCDKICDNKGHKHVCITRCGFGAYVIKSV